LKFLFKPLTNKEINPQYKSSALLHFSPITSIRSPPPTQRQIRSFLFRWATTLERGAAVVSRATGSILPPAPPIAAGDVWQREIPEIPLPPFLLRPREKSIATDLRGERPKLVALTKIGSRRAARRAVGARPVAAPTKISCLSLPSRRPDQNQKWESCKEGGWRMAASMPSSDSHTRGDPAPTQASAADTKPGSPAGGRFVTRRVGRA
jgi:hypothetical protein